jgi:hypothetical protein
MSAMVEDLKTRMFTLQDLPEFLILRVMVEIVIALTIDVIYNQAFMPKQKL